MFSEAFYIIGKFGELSYYIKNAPAEPITFIVDDVAVIIYSVGLRSGLFSNPLIAYDLLIVHPELKLIFFEYCPICCSHSLTC